MSEIPERYRVVANHEEQCSLWPAARELPSGWRDAGKEGPARSAYARHFVWPGKGPFHPPRAREERER